MNNATYKEITIPACAEHNGYLSVTLKVKWNCIYCGAERGEIFKYKSYDGSRAMTVDCWENECGHVEKYADVREHYIKTTCKDSIQGAIEQYEKSVIDCGMTLDQINENETFLEVEVLPKKSITRSVSDLRKLIAD